MKLKKGPKKLITVLLVILVIVAVALLVYYFMFNKTEVKENKVLQEIKEYGYVLKDNKSKKYKDLFYELADELKKKPVDEKKYVKLISQMFIYDFYSLDEKAAKTDVGGTDFLYQEMLNNFLSNAEDTIYKYVESDIYGQRQQTGLPTVKSVKVNSIKQESFTYGETTDEKAYIVQVSWTYTDSNNGYQNKAQMIFVHDGIKLSLVELSDKTAEKTE